MALINCPECDKQISDKAKTCPNCGFPIEEMNKLDEILLQFPELPNDLSIGKPLTNWAGNTHFKGVYDSEGNVIEKITPGVAHVMMYDNGIAISGGMFLNPYSVNNSQIISLKQISRTELGSLNNNDVVGRAVIGALIYGPAGAIIGALTAKKQHSQHYLIINYWDVDSKKAQSLIIGGDKTLINAFIKRHEKEIQQEKKVANKSPESEQSRIEKYGIEIAVCPNCQTVNSLSFLNCEKCNTNLEKVKPIRNPYI